MANLSITAAVDPNDVDAIAESVADRLRPMLETRPRLVDADALAAMLSLSRPSIDRMRAAGVIPSIGSGRLRRFDPDAVIAALASQNEGAAADE